ncbi:conserved hypothetical protein [Gloeothece citriformis PCC 7424]|uniref:Uncharacterized protein n=1 Tax=Gloeothece citriformis (strain PCC 7424) TaxID=65393 RepID=B7KK63_GLOC7|nr:hypothetical protein [Gloeothece citriformis]ACK70948.1 conserved hypothetical protein [Gloeothece citriformis PCC 7424]
MSSEQLKRQANDIPSSNSLSQPLRENPPKLSGITISLWVLWAVYVYILLLSPTGQIIGGEPVWDIQPHTIQEAFNESVNFYFILPILNGLGINYRIAPWVHPVSQGLFNFAEAWMLMFLPLLLADSQGNKLPKVGFWGLAMFLTNVFLIPYMALRSAALPDEKVLPYNKGLISKVLGLIGLFVGCVSLIWGCIAFPESGNIAERGHYFLTLLMSDRLTIAFGVDLVLFWLFQVILLGDVIPGDSKLRWLRFIPFGGLAIWLLE